MVGTVGRKAVHVRQMDVKIFFPSQWCTECPPERFVEGVGCATRGDSLRVAQVMWLRGGCGGCCVRHCLGKRRDVTL